MRFSRLDADHHRALVSAFFRDIADYVWLERDEDPSEQTVDEFFNDAPPGCDPSASARVGMFDAGRLIAIAEMAFGYPGERDAYIGFQAVIVDARGKGAGVMLLRHLEEVARQRQCERIYLAVLDANPRARTFWERQGFVLALANRKVTLGAKTQLAHRMVKAL